MGIIDVEVSPEVDTDQVGAVEFGLVKRWTVLGVAARAFESAFLVRGEGGRVVGDVAGTGSAAMTAFSSSSSAASTGRTRSRDAWDGGSRKAATTRASPSGCTVVGG